VPSFRLVAQPRKPSRSAFKSSSHQTRVPAAEELMSGRSPNNSSSHNMRSSNMLPRQKAPDGFLVVAVLWILAALAALATPYGVYGNATAFGLTDYDVWLQAQELAMAGVELAVYRLTENPDARPAQGKFGFRLGNADVAVDFRSESGRIDLNFAPKQL